MSGSHLFVIGATHHSAPIEVREKLALGPEAQEALGRELKAIADLREFAMLNTCNRIEFYGVGNDGAAARVQAAFCARQNFPASDFEQIRLERSGCDALLHLLGVASGLESQMIGETEIFGQVKEAYAQAQARGTAGPVLNRVFQKAFQAAKQVRTETAITAGQVSVANVAVDLALTIFGSLEGVRVLVLGTGEIGEKTARAFKSRGATHIAVSGRRISRAQEIAADLESQAFDFSEREDRLADFDVVVCSTAAPDTVIGSAAAAAALRKRPARPLFFIDLALPRDVEPEVSRLQNAFLYNLDDLAKIAEENRAARETEIARCRELIRERAEVLWKQVEPRLGTVS